MRHNKDYFLRKNANILAARLSDQIKSTKVYKMSNTLEVFAQKTVGLHDY